MVRRFVCAAVFSAMVFSTTSAGDAVPTPLQAAPIDPEAALARLKAGNARFVQGESTFANLDQDRRCLTTDRGQHPYASILSCSDSRVPPELLFDAGIGELFAIRVAGNVADTDEIGSLEYGAGHLETPLIVVMGHTRCGAVTAVVQGSQLHGSIPGLIDNIAPAVDAAREKHPGVPEARLVHAAIRENVRQSMADVLRHSAGIRQLVVAGKTRLVGAVYDIHNGTIEWIGELPNQMAILDAAAGEDIHDHAAVAHRPSTSPEPVGDSTASIPSDPHALAVTASQDRMPVDAQRAGPAGVPRSPVSYPSQQPAHHVPAKATRPEPHQEDAGHDSGDDDEPTEKPDPHAGLAPKQTLVQKHGLLVPAVFLAAGSALSGTVVFLLKSRGSSSARPVDAKSKPADANPEPAKPAA